MLDKQLEELTQRIAIEFYRAKSMMMGSVPLAADKYPQVSKIVFSSLLANISYVSLSKIQLHTLTGVFNFGTRGSTTPTKSTFANAEITSSATYSSGASYYVGSAIKNQNFSTNYWLTSSITGGATLTINLNTPTTLTGISYCDYVLDDRGANNYTITLYDKDNNIVGVRYAGQHISQVTGQEMLVSFSDKASTYMTNKFIQTDVLVTSDKKALLDTHTGYEWLKLTETRGQTIGAITNRLSTDLAGWRLPTEAEMRDFFTRSMPVVGLNNTLASTYTNQPYTTQVLWFNDVLGTGSRTANTTHGWYKKPSGVWAYTGSYVNGSNYTMFSGFDVATAQDPSWGDTTSLPGSGMFLISKGVTKSSKDNPTLNDGIVLPTPL